MMLQATITTNLWSRVQVLIDPLPAVAWQILSIFDHGAQLRESCDCPKTHCPKTIIKKKRLQLPLIEKNLKTVNAE